MLSVICRDNGVNCNFNLFAYSCTQAGGLMQVTLQEKLIVKKFIQVAKIIFSENKCHSKITQYD